MRFVSQLLAAISAFGTAAATQAQDANRAGEWPRYHVGVAIGRSHYTDSWSSAGVPEHLQPNYSPEGSPTGWKIVAGLRPIRFVGAELQHVDFGSATTRSAASGNQVVRRGAFMRNDADATVVSALLFLPEGLSSVDFYGKVGVAEVEESLRVSVYRYVLCGPPGPNCMFFSDVTETDSRSYLGIGARFKIARDWAVRVEYESIDGDVHDDTTMFSLGVAWER